MALSLLLFPGKKRSHFSHAFLYFKKVISLIVSTKLPLYVLQRVPSPV